MCLTTIASTTMAGSLVLLLDIAKPIAPLAVATRKDMHMDIMATLDVIDFLFDEDERKVCVFCDQDTYMPACPTCLEYKGLMSISEWEDYTGEVWE